MLNTLAIILLSIGIFYTFYSMNKETKDTHGHKL